jgi:hypothetical protein
MGMGMGGATDSTHAIQVQLPCSHRFLLDTGVYRHGGRSRFRGPDHIAVAGCMQVSPIGPVQVAGGAGQTATPLRRPAKRSYENPAD